MTEREQYWALITGAAVLLMAVTGGIAYGYLHPMLYVPENVEVTKTSLERNPTLLTLVVGAWGLVAALDVTASIGVYELYKRRARSSAATTAVLRLIYSLILVMAVGQLAALILDNEWGRGQARFEAFENMWSAGLVIFGVHLLSLAWLIYHVENPSRFVALMLAFGGTGYIILRGLELIGIQGFFIPSIVEITFSVPMVLGELMFATRLVRRQIMTKPISGVRLPADHHD